MSGGSTPNALSPAAETPPSQSSGGDLNLLSTPTTAEAPSVPQRSAGKYAEPSDVYRGLFY